MPVGFFLFTAKSNSKRFFGDKNNSYISQMNTINIFFKDRKIFLTDGIQPHNEQTFSYRGKEQLGDLLKTFFEDERIKEMVVQYSDLSVLLNDFKSFFTYIEAAGGLVRNSKNQLLVIMRFGRPDLPKGKTEKNESPEQAAVREVEEECGIHGPIITGKAEPSFHIYIVKNQWFLKKTEWYHMTYSGNELLKPQSKEFIIAVEWCYPDRIRKYRHYTYPSIMKYFV